MITRWPGESLHAFDRFNKMMDDLTGADEFRSVWSPLVDVKETPKELTFVVETPGLEEKDVTVELAGNRLMIGGHREIKSEENRDEYVRLERYFGSFQRTFTLDVPVKPELINANIKNGLLTVVVPKVENKPKHKIEVKAK